MNAADVMTRAVVTVAPDTTIAEAARLLLGHRISGLPVVDRSCEMVGILTEGDLLRRAETGTERQRPRWLEFLLGPGRLARDYVDTHARLVSEVMTEDVVSVPPQTPLPVLVRLMEARHIKRLPVVDGGRVVGIVSRANLVHALLNALAKPAAGTSSDEEIRARILAEISNQPWGPRTSVDVAVKDGIVEYCGVILDERERNALRVLAENITGVKAVKDHTVWVDAASGIVIPAE
jgi:CBS domain-containing protein